MAWSSSGGRPVRMRGEISSCVRAVTAATSSSSVERAGTTICQARSRSLARDTRSCGRRSLSHAG